MPLTTYICGHTWKTGLNGTPKEQERLRKIVERWSKTEECAYCKMQKGTWKAWTPNNKKG